MHGFGCPLAQSGLSNIYEQFQLIIKYVQVQLYDIVITATAKKNQYIEQAACDVRLAVREDP